MRVTREIYTRSCKNTLGAWTPDSQACEAQKVVVVNSSCVEAMAQTTPSLVLGRVIYRLRKRCNISQGMLAGRVGLSQSALSKSERGNRSISVVELYRWSQAVGIGPDHVVLLWSKVLEAAKSAGIQVIDHPTLTHLVGPRALDVLINPVMTEVLDGVPPWPPSVISSWKFIAPKEGE